ATAVPRADTSGLAVSYLQNAVHDGHSVHGVAAPPLRRQWARRFEGPVSYALVAEGLVFVVVPMKPVETQTGTLLGARVHALDAHTGKVRWRSGRLGSDFSAEAGITYGDGRIYAAEPDGGLVAYAARTGRRLWQRSLPGGSSGGSTGLPVYAGGRVYVTAPWEEGDGAIYAVDARTGRVAWYGEPIGPGPGGPAAVTATGIFLGSACGATGIRPDGRLLWLHEGLQGCGGGNGPTSVAAAGRLWLRPRQWIEDSKPVPCSGSSEVLDLRTGKYVAGFGTACGTPAPAFSGSTGFFVDEAGTLSARPVTRPTAVTWRFAADRKLTVGPLVVDGVVWVGSSTGRLWAVDARTGRRLWSTDVGAGMDRVRDDESSRPPVALAAGQGHLIVPAGSLLVSYGR
ncbi:MAG TPA: PQQ-binding-like beta-propeller repeat protein, partial [Kineosporiaceae bacterium]|nr:PQQ-binding-like beta-propeller repeat protein [Kineosporiaceae bacterium]